MLHGIAVGLGVVGGVVAVLALIAVGCVIFVYTLKSWN